MLVRISSNSIFLKSRR